MDDEDRRTMIKRSKFSYRAFADGHFEDFNKTKNYTEWQDLKESGDLYNWANYYNDRHVLEFQSKLAMDPASDPYREADGSILYPPFTQSDFLFVPTRYTDIFEKAATLHAKHDIFLEVAVNKIVDIVVQETNATTRNVDLCTDWWRRRGKDLFMDLCYNRTKDGNFKYGFIHPFKLHFHGYEHWAKGYDKMNDCV